MSVQIDTVDDSGRFVELPEVFALFFRQRFGHPCAILVKPAIGDAERQSARLFPLALQFCSAPRVVLRPRLQSLTFPTVFSNATPPTIKGIGGVPVRIASGTSMC